MMQFLDAVELYRFFHTGGDEVMALRGVSLSIGEGEMIALVGPSGSGKSTLLTCLAGLDEPDGGTVWLMGGMMSRRPEGERASLRAKHLGVMRQKGNLFEHLTIDENLALTVSLAQDRSEPGAMDILKRVGLTSHGSYLPSQLSGGERARASIAVAMACYPRVLLLDEPTGETDAEAERSVLSLLAEFLRNGGAAVVATHNPAIGRLATRILAMKDGRIING